MNSSLIQSSCMSQVAKLGSWINSSDPEMEQPEENCDLFLGVSFVPEMYVYIWK